MISLVQCSIGLCSGEIVHRLVVIANARTNLRGSRSPTSGRSSRSMMFAWIESIANIKDSVSVILMHRKGASCFATNYDDDTEHAVTCERQMKLISWSGHPGLFTLIRTRVVVGSLGSGRNRISARGPAPPPSGRGWGSARPSRIAPRVALGISEPKVSSIVVVLEEVEGGGAFGFWGVRGGFSLLPPLLRSSSMVIASEDRCGPSPSSFLVKKKKLPSYIIRFQPGS
ncbi:hypothetical protein NL676_017324 [Syzygium grande]|nr:hypothetical protein NL676_017324 [Syzygium grande]